MARSGWKMWRRFAGWTGAGLAAAIALLVGTLIVGAPEGPAWIGDLVIGIYLGGMLGLAQSRAVRRDGLPGREWALATTVAVSVAAVVVQGPLEETGWGLLAEGTAHALVMGLLLAVAQWPLVRDRVGALPWVAAGLAAAWVGELTGRLVGLVTPSPLDLVVVFLVWHALVGLALARTLHPADTAAADGRQLVA
jgi:hypothetical protein